MDKERHPRGLYVLFFTEMWERFSFYLILGILLQYLTDHEKGGMGMSGGDGTVIVGSYQALAYFTPFIGGLIADRQRGRHADPPWPGRVRAARRDHVQGAAQASRRRPPAPAGRAVGSAATSRRVSLRAGRCPQSLPDLGMQPRVHEGDVPVLNVVRQ